LSKAGKQKGLNQTRSGLVYEVLRILQELHQVERLPKVLIMENVVDLIQVKFIREFQAIQLELENLGYTNYTQTLNAKDCGVAQNRDRVFMVSILVDYYYEFPQPIKLEKRLKDYLESEVDSKYYLSEKLLKTFMDTSHVGKFNREGKFRPHDLDGNHAYSVTTREVQVSTGNYIKIPEDTKQGYAKAYDGDGVYTNRPHQKRGVVQSGMIQTLKTSCSDVGVVTNAKCLYLNDSDEFRKNPLEEISRCIKANKHDSGVIENNLRIRKLTPLECWRLMGIYDTDFHKASQVCSNSQLYKQAGNGIVVDVFAAIVKELL